MVGVLFMLSCSGNKGTSVSTEADEKPMVTENEGGKLSAEFAIKSVELTNPLDQSMVSEGEKISEMKCTSCHNLTEERLVGPGWLNITERRKPEWIMNMITNVDVMLAEDEEAQKMFEECLVRMPNQNISVSEARSILEFMRHNDGVE